MGNSSNTSSDSETPGGKSASGKGIAYRRILLKLSGEVFGGEAGIGFDHNVIKGIASQVNDVASLGIEIGLVVGGGNIFRGASSAPAGFDRVTGDHMGMLATVINAICLQEALEAHGLETRVMTAFEIRSIAEPYIKRRAHRHLEKGRVIIFAGGTGHPFFTTDTAAALRASEIGAEVLIKGTKVDGIYSSDPVRDSSAVRYETLSYQEVLRNELRIMDTTAIAFCKDNGIPILVLNIEKSGTLLKVMKGHSEGTLVTQNG